MRKIINFLNRCLLAAIVLAAPLKAVPVSAANENHKPITASVAVRFTGDGVAEIEQISGPKYEPNEKRLIIHNEEKTFNIIFDEPGNYRYKIWQNKGSDSSIKYDSTVYEALFVVTTDPDAVLHYEVVIFQQNTDKKPDKIHFINEYIPGGENGYKPSNTSDNSRIFFYEAMLAFSALTVIAILVFMNSRKTKKHE